MCFSATASFTTAGVLSVLGARSIILAARQRPHVYGYAAIPLLFAVQQFAEGMVWISLPNNPEMAHADAILFLYFAFILWPLWVPNMLLPLEQDRWRIYALKILAVCGALFSATALYMGIYHQFTVEILHHSIAYHFSIPAWAEKYGLLFYLVPMALPWFVSSKRILHLFGLLGLVSMTISYWWWQHTFTSVWCFFVALLSTLVWVSLEFKLLDQSVRN